MVPSRRDRFTLNGGQNGHVARHGAPLRQKRRLLRPVAWLQDSPDLFNLTPSRSFLGIAWPNIPPFGSLFALSASVHVGPSKNSRSSLSLFLSRSPSIFFLVVCVARYIVNGASPVTAETLRISRNDSNKKPFFL